MSWRDWEPGPDATDQERLNARKGFVVGEDSVSRCWWAHVAPDYLGHHDSVWGFPIAADTELFEWLSIGILCMGLSPWVGLRKRDGIRDAFANFDLERVAQFDERDVRQLLEDQRVIRVREKIEAIINNAQRALAIAESEGSFAHHVWRSQPKVDALAPDRHEMVRRSKSAKSGMDLKESLKRAGLRLIGPVTAYAFMQTVGLVNDHVLDCDTRSRVEAARKRFVRP